jgi:death-on-curing protein
MKEPEWLLEAAVLAIHDEQIAEHGGYGGIRDQGLLLSALAHPQNLFHYGSPSMFKLAAAYAARIVKNHPFIDGNKRTAYIAARLFLILNRFDLTASREEKVRTFLKLAAGEMSEVDLARWIETNSKKMKR